MRMMNKGGATPCDRRLDRRKVAIAAAAALFLLATEARANIVDFRLVESMSFLKQTSKIFGAGIGSHISSPQFPDDGDPDSFGSDTTTYFGQMYVDINPLTIQLMPGAYISAQIGAPGAGGVPGLYTPRDPVISDPLSPPNAGLQPNSNYGLQIPNPPLGVASVQYNIRIDNGNAFAPSTAMGLAGNNFNLAGQGMRFTDGRQAFFSGLGNDTGDLVNDPVIFFGTNGLDIGTWDPLDLTAGPLGTLTIPVHSVFQFRITNDFGGIDQQLIMAGQLVLTPYVPEPSSMTILGFGIVGLLSCAWRARKRSKALVA